MFLTFCKNKNYFNKVKNYFNKIKIRVIFVVIELYFILENWNNFLNRTLVGEDSGVAEDENFNKKFNRITTIELCTNIL
ncbi:hypothetical protein [Chryseobacterium gambrini]|uniref:hypothetical protein n=1 Tax=Chryseobacterium gambrini TaxID=373672 RepID=UPI0025B2F19D|nr:hypothetical protein [Chryseobacterium gambrini]MDN4028993.1 hypothetical protein [Chryseobacterium gambrini]